jgi:hypothetical protein
MLSFSQFLIEYSEPSIERFEGPDINLKADSVALESFRKKAVMDAQYKRANEILKTMPSDLRTRYVQANDLEGVLNYGKDKDEEIRKFDSKDMRRMGALATITADTASSKGKPVGTWPGYLEGDVALFMSVAADNELNLEKEKGHNTDLGLMLDYEGHPKDGNVVMNPAGREAVRRREKEGRSVQFEPYDFSKETAKMRKFLNPFGGGFMSVPK